MYMYIHVHIHVHIHIYIYTYTYTCFPVQSSFGLYIEGGKTLKGDVKSGKATIKRF